MNDQDKINTHPSYAQISASRITSTAGIPMYGSKLRHSRFINITISESEIVRSSTQDRYHDGKQLIRVRMTENQFAQFITSLNIGGGTPCTVERFNMRPVEEPPFQDEKKLIRTEFERKSEEVAATLQNAQNRLAKLLAPGSKITKAELTELQNEIETAAREIGANMPYMTECFEETIEDVVAAAKTDIEAYAADAAARAGAGLSSAPIIMIEGSETRK